MQTDETRAREVLAATVPLSISSAWTAEEERQIIRAMIAFAAPPAVEREGEIAARLKVNAIIAKHFVPLIDNLGDAIRAGNQACTEIIAALSPTLHPADREEGKGDASGFDLVGAIVQHMSDDLGFVVGHMPNEDQQRFYRLRDKAREWLIAEGARLDAILALSGSLAPANPTERDPA